MAGPRGDLARKIGVGHRSAAARLGHSLRRGPGRLRVLADRYSRPVSSSPFATNDTGLVIEGQPADRSGQGSRDPARLARSSFDGSRRAKPVGIGRLEYHARPDVRGGRGREKTREGESTKRRSRCCAPSSSTRSSSSCVRRFRSSCCLPASMPPARARRPACSTSGWIRTGSSLAATPIRPPRNWSVPDCGATGATFRPTAASRCS